LPATWVDWLGDGSGIGYDLTQFTGKVPRLAIAFSGGGHRAALFGAGVRNALDIRNDSAKNAGTGGLLQAASYVSGLSGA
jgi:lysophospholipase